VKREYKEDATNPSFAKNWKSWRARRHRSLRSLSRSGSLSLFLSLFLSLSFSPYQPVSRSRSTWSAFTGTYHQSNYSTRTFTYTLQTLAPVSEYLVAFEWSENQWEIHSMFSCSQTKRLQRSLLHHIIPIATYRADSDVVVEHCPTTTTTVELAHTNTNFLEGSRKHSL
jgi:hypothetical protein